MCGGRAQGGVWDRAELAERQGQVRQQDRFGEKQQRGRSGKGREGKAALSAVSWPLGGSSLQHKEAMSEEPAAHS